MASIDSRTGDADFQDEIYLKLWHWDKKTAAWTLNTRIDRPHGLGSVLDMSFSPRPNGNAEIYLVTVGSDGTVKTWRTRPQTSKRNSLEGHFVLLSPDGLY